MSAAQLMAVLSGKPHRSLSKEWVSYIGVLLCVELTYQCHAHLSCAGPGDWGAEYSPKTKGAGRVS